MSKVEGTSCTELSWQYVWQNFIILALFHVYRPVTLLLCIRKHKTVEHLSIQYRNLRLNKHYRHCHVAAKLSSKVRNRIYGNKPLWIFSLLETLQIACLKLTSVQSMKSPTLLFASCHWRHYSSRLNGNFPNTPVWFSVPAGIPILLRRLRQWHKYL